MRKASNNYQYGKQILVEHKMDKFKLIGKKFKNNLVGEHPVEIVRQANQFESNQ